MKRSSMIALAALTLTLSLAQQAQALSQGARHKAAKAGTAAAAPAASAPAPLAEPGIPPEHIAAIAAAISAMGGNMRAVRLTDTTTGQIWASEGRWLHQTSHQTH